MTDQKQITKQDKIETKTAIELVLQTDKLFTLDTPDGLISDCGSSELQGYMYDQGLGELPKDFEFVWVTKRGTLPKRITSHCYKANKIKLTPVQVSELGNIARRHSSIAQTYLCDFTQDFNWSAGDYGDSGSCYWGSNSGARLMLADNGAYALRLYRFKSVEPEKQELTYNNVRGYARAWVIKTDDNKLVVFNGYPSGSLDFARLLALKFNCSYKKLNLTNRGSQGGLLYINSGSFIVGQWSKIEATTSHDLDWSDIDSEPDEPDEPESSDYICSQCDYDIGNEDDVIYSYDRYNEHVPCCCDCTSYCDSCSENYTTNMMRELDGEAMCRGCRESILEQRAQEAQEARELEIAELDRQQEALATRLEQEQASVAVVAVESEATILE